MIKFLHNLMARLEKALSLLKSVNKVGFSNLYLIVKYIEISHGHLNSVKKNSSVDYNNNPIPWYTYPAIEYLIQFEYKDKKIFEYGSGNSSLFWSERAKSVTSVESDKAWFNMVVTKQLKNQVIFLRDNKIQYTQSINEENEDYDVIIVDGKWRYDCAKNAIGKIKDDGIIILDNSDWYPNTAKYIREAGMLQVDFIGLGPINYYAWTTSVFFRPTTKLRPINDIQPQNGLGSLVQCGEGDINFNT